MRRNTARNSTIKVLTVVYAQCVKYYGSLVGANISFAQAAISALTLARLFEHLLSVWIIVI